MRRTMKTAVIAALVVGAAGTGTAVAHPSSSAPTAQPDDNECPEVMRGVKLSTSRSERGVTFEFTTPRSENVGDLQLLLREAGKAVEEHSHEPRAAMTRDGAESAGIPPVKISVKDVRAGAKVTVRADNARDVDEVRQQAASFQELWDNSDCVDKPETVSMPSDTL